MKKKLKVLIACEESQRVCQEFRNLGHEAYSCDLLPTSGDHPEWHFMENMFEVLDRINDFDLMIAHPPCTYVASSGAQWLSHPADSHLPFNERRPHPKYPNRRQDMLDSIEFVRRIWNSGVPRIAIENPVGLLSNRFMKPTQIIQPYYFGDEATKTTCLWLKNLPLLQPTSIVGKGERVVYASGNSMSKWCTDICSIAKTKEERQTLRSKTFPGIAKAMATQWSEYVLNENV